MSKNNKNSTVLRFANLEEFAKLLAKENVRLCTDTGDGSGVPGATNTILSLFVKHYVETIITDALLEHKDNKSLPKDQLIQKTERSLNIAKNMIQDGVADGMALAMSKWAKQDLAYFCVIRREPQDPTIVYNQEFV